MGREIERQRQGQAYQLGEEASVEVHLILGLIH